MSKNLDKRHQLVRSMFTSGPAVIWLSILLFAPLVVVAFISLLSKGDYGELQLPVTLENYKRLLGYGELGFDPLYPAILARSLALGFGTALISLIAGLPLALFIARLPERYKNPALTLVIIPFWTNLLIRTYAWQIMLSPQSWLTILLHRLGIGTAGEALYPGAFAVGLGMVCDYLPFMVLPLYASVQKLDWHLTEAAMDLGAGRLNVYRHAIFPQIKPGLISGFILVFLPATGQFVIPDLLGGAKTVMLGNAIQQQFGQSRDWPFGSAINSVALAMVLVGLWLYARSAGKNGGESLL